MDGGLKHIGQLKEITRGNIKYYFLGFGIMVGVLFYTYGLYLLFGLNYDCMCQRMNLATFLDSHLDDACQEYAENDYKAYQYVSERDTPGGEFDSLLKDPQGMLTPQQILYADGFRRGRK